jgi:hypothetical protein
MLFICPDFDCPLTADHYPTEDLKMIYVLNRTGGKSRKHSTPPYQTGDENEFQT